MKKRCFTIMSVIILGVVMSLNVKAQSLVNDKTAAKMFVQRFYNWYVPLYNKPIDNKSPVTAYDVALNQKGNYFDARLHKALIDDGVAQAKVPGEIVGIDFDPFLAAQDDGFGYQAGDVKQTGNGYQIDIHVAEIRKSPKQILAGPIQVIAEVTKVGTSWKFTNFIYPADRNSKQSDLLQILANLRKDREKPKK